MVFFKHFTKTTCENWLYYAESGTPVGPLGRPRSASLVCPGWPNHSVSLVSLRSASVICPWFSSVSPHGWPENGCIGLRLGSVIQLQVFIGQPPRMA